MWSLLFLLFSFSFLFEFDCVRGELTVLELEARRSVSLMPLAEERI